MYNVPNNCLFIINPVQPHPLQFNCMLPQGFSKHDKCRDQKPRKSYSVNGLW